METLFWEKICLTQRVWYAQLLDKGEEFAQLARRNQDLLLHGNITCCSLRVTRLGKRKPASAPRKAATGNRRPDTENVLSDDFLLVSMEVMSRIFPDINPLQIHVYTDACTHTHTLGSGSVLENVLQAPVTMQ